MTKRYAKCVTALFCIFIGSIFLLSLLLPKKKFSVLENRYLAQLPALTSGSLSSGKFTEAMEDYVSDHIVCRDFWVALKAVSERLSGKRENNGIYLADGDTLISRVEAPAQEDLDNALTAVNALADSLSVPTCFALVPSAAAVWTDRLPVGAPTADELGIIHGLYAETAADPIDVASALLAHKDEAIYYRTDHHWTSLGAFYGANAILEALELEPLNLSDHAKTTVSTDFYGTSFSSSGVRWLTPDCIDIYVPEAGVEVTSWFTDKAEAGQLYADKFLGQKDKYSYFLGGNQPLCVIESEYTNAPNVLLVRDSFADTLAPFLTERFSEVHLFDLRYNRSSIPQYVEAHDIDYVIVLYCFPGFATDPHLSQLHRS